MYEGSSTSSCNGILFYSITISTQLWASLQTLLIVCFAAKDLKLQCHSSVWLRQLSLLFTRFLPCLPAHIICHMPVNQVTPEGHTCNDYRMYCYSHSPAAAQYRSSLPTGMLSPLHPRSPSPRIRLPSVTTIAATSDWGQLYAMAACSHHAAAAQVLRFESASGRQ